MCLHRGGIRREAMLALVALWSVPGVASALSIDMSPRRPVLLADGTRFVAQDGWNSLALYRAADAAVIYQFPAPGWVNRVAVSADERWLLIACSDASLAVWDLGTGNRVWEQSRRQTGLEYVYDASFAHDGESCVVCGRGDQQAVVLKTATGERLGIVRFPPMQTSIMSAALAPNGRSGVLIELGQRVYTFDLSVTTPQDTGLTGGWPVRYSADGRYVAFRSNNSGTAERLSVVRVGNEWAKKDFGQFTYIGHIRPARDGTFLVTAQIGGRYDETAVNIGVQVWPEVGRVQELWKLKPDHGVNDRTDYLSGAMVGVSTDWRLVTKVVALRSGRTEREIDNSENMAAPDSRGMTLGSCGAAVLVAVAGGWLIWRRRSRSIGSVLTPRPGGEGGSR